MTKKLLFGVQVFLTICLLMVSGMQSSAGAAWWDKFGEPQYGGTITLPANSMSFSFDPYKWMGIMGWNYWYEALWMPDWTLDRSKHNFFTLDWIPAEYWKGLLAESWEWTDPQTLTVHLRKGVKWQNREPVNGREFVADDVVYHFDRIFGMGSFKEGSPFFAGRFNTAKEVTAPDKYTVVFKFKAPSTIVNAWSIICEPMLQTFEAREVIDKYGKELENNWKLVVGTGPFMLTDYQANTSMTMSKNPDYWGYDERHPKNKLPYADEVKLLCITDQATQLAALRSGKIDRLEQIDWKQAESLTKTNPDLQKAMIGQPGALIQLRVDRKPFTDINVRRALQMALNLPDIANHYYGGTVDWKPHGVSQFEGYYNPYDEWPQALKDDFAYNPEKAKEILAKAGYPNGFKTNVIAASNQDMQLLQVIKDYFKDINVDMEIRAMDMFAAGSLIQAAKHDQMNASTLSTSMPPIMAATMHTFAEKNNGCRNNDPEYESIVQQLSTATSVEQAQELVKKADMRYLTQHWSILTFPIANYVFWQPYLKGYSGEKVLWGQGPYYARYFIDGKLKKTMGR